MSTDFDQLTDRRGTYCDKWDRAQNLYAIPDDGLPMWIADHDFRLPDFVLDAGRRILDHGIIGYGYDQDGYHEAIRWWLSTHYGWAPEPSAIFSATGLGNGIAMCLDTYTDPGDAVITFNPVYPEFEAAIRGAGRVPLQSEMKVEDGIYRLDLDTLEAQLTGREKILLFCSPHNPGGRVWTRDELESVAEFARRHDLLLISDEIHQDLVYPGAQHIPMAHIDGIEDRLIVLFAASKTFSLPGMRVGSIIIPDRTLGRQMAQRQKALRLKINAIGVAMVTAALSPEGAAWARELVAYLDGNRALFETGVDALPGIHAMPIQSTFLSWVDFSGTGMAPKEFTDRVERVAGIAASHGTAFGPGGENYLRFNLGTQRARIEEAVSRLSRAFADLQ